MNVNRRNFLQAGLLAGAAASAACASRIRPSSIRFLTMKIRGLMIVERSEGAAQLNLLDGGKLGIATHLPRLVIPKSAVDFGQTTAPWTNGTIGIIPAAVFDLHDREMSLAGTFVPGSMTRDDSPVVSTLPPDADSWSSTKYAADLRTLTGATAMNSAGRGATYATVKLHHGHLHATTPDAFIGQFTIWTFTTTSATGEQVVAKQALTDTLVCDMFSVGPNAKIILGSQNVTLNLAGFSMQEQILVTNQPDPASPKPVCMPEPGAPTGSPLPVVCVDHLAKLYDLVDSAFKPHGKGAIALPPAASMVPDYCPPAEI